MDDLLFHGTLSDLDPALSELNQIEAERQHRKLILIPSESTAPLAVRELLSSSFQNLYAEGYPDEETRWMTEDQILDYPARLAHFRRYSDPRYYKGVEYADVVESLARRRCAEVYATDRHPAEQLFVNIQALSGAPANNAVYHALINPGDTILGMNLLHGGHLTHGSPVNRSGKLYNAVHYTVDPSTEQIDYDAVQKIAEENKPKIIVAGYSSYPFVPDWQRFRQIADSVGAYLLADISHIAGLVAAKAVPSPIGYAHIVTFTTHKTLTGPRGASIITTDAGLAKKIDRAVFPGEQGGPHVNTMAALALIFKLSKTEQFVRLQKQIIRNAAVLTNRLQERGLRVPFNGTDTHLGNVDCKSIKGPDGAELSGDMAARILDVVGIVLNRNTIPGDKNALAASGIRYGTPWMTQRGLGEKEMIEVADIIADVLFATVPFKQASRKGYDLRAKVDFKVLEDAKRRVRALCDAAARVEPTQKSGYPHFFYLDDQPAGKSAWSALEISTQGVLQVGTYSPTSNADILQPNNALRPFLNFVFSSDVEALSPGASQKTCLVTPLGEVHGTLTLTADGKYIFSMPSEHFGVAATWLRDLSDGYIQFDPDLLKKIPGPVIVKETEPPASQAPAVEAGTSKKPYHIGISPASGEALPKFAWEEKEPAELRRTSLYETHKQSGAKLIPFAGWEMPVWYTSVSEEHMATRQAAGLFDVSHMGVYQCEGPDAHVFLDSVCANDIASLAVGESCYTHFLDVDANVIDDLLVYRRSADKYLVVVNASNDDKNWAWLNAVLNGEVMVDPNYPHARAFGRNVILRNLRDPQAGAEMRVDIALQGPKSRDMLLALGCDATTRQRIMRLKRTNLTEAVVGGFDLVVSRTGYTGEKMAFELFVHPDQAPALWAKLMEIGAPMGLKPCGLGARDSLRTEAGLPLYGHEMGGEKNLGVAEAGFGYYVKTYKPWFIGRDAFLRREAARKGEVIRFRFEEKGVRMAHSGDPVMDKKGKVIGYVTSCAIDSDGYLTGQAFIDLKYGEEGAAILIYQGAADKPGKAPAQLASGDRVTLPSSAIIMSRFPKP
ncbi:MAG: glycine cleavage system aminomethyltransferase GcvT [Chloroflexi bacterium]|nr:glycine cleavage system aminomethyltransferase GcvT [Chloroflexota bacterium]